MSYAINQVAVIGAGTMGAAIAAHMANAGIPAYLLDIVPGELTPKEEAKGLTLEHPAVRNRIVNEGWQKCLKSRPPSLFSAAYAERVTVGNLEDNLEWLGRADWIIEVIVERLDIKQQLMARIEAVRKPGSIVSTNTSGIPIKKIAGGRSAGFKAHFLGTHFFNPPRYLKLLEIIPHERTKPDLVEFMAEFGTRTLGKGAVICKDTPNFVANRFISLVGGYSLNYALDNGYTVEEVDSLTGPTIGHPKTASFRLFDLVGIDIMAHVNRNLYPAIPDDAYRKELKHEKSAALNQALLERKWLGNKTGQGFYKRVNTPEGRQFWVLDLETMDYAPPQKPRFDSVGKHRNVKDVGERIRLICAEEDRAASFIWATTAFGCNYAAALVPDVADEILSIDNANKWGFGHQLGPFEIWDALGVRDSVARMEAEGLAVTPWVKEMLAAGVDHFYKKEGSSLSYYDPASKGYKPVKPDARAIALKDTKTGKGKVVASNASASLVDLGDGVLCLEFHSKANALDTGIFDMLNQAGDKMERGWQGMVIGNQGAHFCAGADLNSFVEYAQNQAWDEMDDLIQRIQNALMRFRYSPKPVVSAPFGVVLGGGAEVMMAASAICAAAESYIGQVEAGVGVVPALGGCKEPMRRILSPVVKRTPNIDLLPVLQQVFEMIAMAKVSGSADQAREWGFLTPTDRVVMNADHLLYEAKRMVLEMVESGYRPPVPGKEIWAMGATGLAALETGVWGFRESGYISEHDALIANKTAYILCGSKLSQPQWVEAQYILDLEREAFLSLLGTQKTLDRVMHMLKTGKPLRN